MQNNLPYHNLLRRQIRRHFPKGASKEIEGFLDEIHATYLENDTDRLMLERALDITSAEMMEAHRNIRIDLERRLMAEKALAEANKKMLGAQRHESLGHLAGSIAHDFNNILGIIAGFVDAIEMGNISDKEISGFCGSIRFAVDRGSSLTARILAYTKNQMVNSSFADVHNTLQELMPILTSALGQGISVITDFRAGKSVIKIDEDHFAQILINLAVNARQAMNDKGHFSISTDNDYFRPEEVLNQSFVESDLTRFTDRTSSDAEPPHEEQLYICLKFSDTGCGIKKENIDRIFEPYFSTKARGEGTGLGLAVVYGLVKQMDGYIFCESVEQEGTVFRIYLPTRDEAPEATLNKKPETAPKSYQTCSENGRINILVIDDEEHLRQSMVRFLIAEGFNVHNMPNGPMAVQFVETFPEKLDLIISDLMMPGMSGIEAVEEINLLQPEAAVMYVSGYSEEMLKEKNVRWRDSLLQKPFTRERFLHRVYGILQ